MAALAIRPDGHYVDATFGRGGHAAAILAKLGPTGSLLALDRDPNAAEWAKAKFADDGRFQFVWSRFSKLADSVAERGLSGRLNGVLLDLGGSSPQLDDPARGFSFVQRVRSSRSSPSITLSRPGCAATRDASGCRAPALNALTSFGACRGSSERPSRATSFPSR